MIANADKSVTSISKDVSLTSSVLKELGEILDKDGEIQKLTPTAIGTADTVVKECLDVFQEMETMLVKKLPQLHVPDADKASKSTILLERLKWPYLQPKLRLLQSNLEKLKSTILLMLNVIMYARQMRSHTPYRRSVRSVRDVPDRPMTDQVSLIEGLAQSNKDKIRAFEHLKLGTDINLFALQNNSEEEVKESASTEYEEDLQESEFRENHRFIRTRHCLRSFYAMLHKSDAVKYRITTSSRTRIRKGLHDMCNNEMNILGKALYPTPSRGHTPNNPGRTFSNASSSIMSASTTGFTPTMATAPLFPSQMSSANAAATHERQDFTRVGSGSGQTLPSFTTYSMPSNSQMTVPNSDDTVDPSKIVASPASARRYDSNQPSSTIHPELKKRSLEYESLDQAYSSSHDPNDGGAEIAVGQGTGQPLAHTSSADALNQSSSYRASTSSASFLTSYTSASGADPFLVEGPPSSPQCWDHGCNGRHFTTFGNLLRHQREKTGSSAKSVCHRCGAAFTRKTARDGHLAHGKCEQILPVLDSPVDSLSHPAKKRHCDEESEGVVLTHTSNNTDNDILPESRFEACCSPPPSMGRTSPPMRIPSSMHLEQKSIERPHTINFSNSQVVDDLMALWITPSYYASYTRYG